MLDRAKYFWCGSSLEHFLYRFWLENEIWFATNRNEPLSVEQQQYLSAATAARGRLPPER